jgi:hypothetical protein
MGSQDLGIGTVASIHSRLATTLHNNDAVGILSFFLLDRTLSQTSIALYWKISIPPFYILASLATRAYRTKSLLDISQKYPEKISDVSQTLVEQIS